MHRSEDCVTITLSRSEAVEVLSFLESFPVETAGGCSEVSCNPVVEGRAVSLASNPCDDSKGAEPAVPSAKDLSKALDEAVKRVGVESAKATLQKYGQSLKDVPDAQRAALLAEVVAL